LVANLKNCSKNLIPSRTLVAMATKRKNLKYLLLENSIFLKFDFPEIFWLFWRYAAVVAL
jgi:hypothetical protein